MFNLSHFVWLNPHQDDSNLHKRFGTPVETKMIGNDFRMAVVLPKNAEIVYVGNQEDVPKVEICLHQLVAIKFSALISLEKSEL